MNGKLMLYLDQRGMTYTARTVKELQTKCGGGRVGKMYVDKNDGRTVHIGYVIGRLWLRAYTPVERPA